MTNDEAVLSQALMVAKGEMARALKERYRADGIQAPDFSSRDQFLSDAGAPFVDDAGHLNGLDVELAQAENAMSELAPLSPPVAARAMQILRQTLGAVE